MISLKFDPDAFETLCTESPKFREIVYHSLLARKRKKKNQDSPALAAFRESVKKNPNPMDRIQHIKAVRMVVPGMQLAEAKEFVENIDNRRAVGLLPWHY